MTTQSETPRSYLSSEEDDRGYSTGEETSPSPRSVPKPSRELDARLAGLEGMVQELAGAGLEDAFGELDEDGDEPSSLGSPESAASPRGLATHGRPL